MGGSNEIDGNENSKDHVNKCSSCILTETTTVDTWE